MTVDEFGPKELWRNPQPENTQLQLFKNAIESKYGLKFPDDSPDSGLYQWSIDNISQFWAEVWDFTKIKCSKTYDTVVDEKAPMFPRPTFFSGAKLNFAENILFPASVTDENEVAVIAATEISREHITWKELREKVRVCRNSMLAMGVKEGDRIAGYVGNHANTLVAMLAASSVGAIWTATSPDVGVSAVLERLAQISPTILFADNAVVYNSKTHDNLAKLNEVVNGLGSTLKATVVFDSIEHHPTLLNKIQGNAMLYRDFLDLGDKNTPLDFLQLDFDFPLYILYSSGTTGKPKCIIHGAGGTLIQHKKEHQIHCDMGPKDTFFQFSTTAWMMWHWNISALASGTKAVLYDGSPFVNPNTDGCGDLAMPALLEELGVTCFGTSAKYLSILEQRNTMPKQKYPLSKLRAIYSTGSVLAPSTFDYIYKQFGNINLGSITGGTDIISLFGAPSSILPVYRGEIQCRGLGMAVKAFDSEGKEVFNEPGDLVCVKAFPCQPVNFWPGGIEGERLYKKSYFEQFPGVWCHGDFIQINETRQTMLMLGRSDGVLKPCGVRFGSAELYNVILGRFGEEIEDALCVGRRRPEDSDEDVIAFLKMAPGHSFSDDLASRVKDTIRKELSQRHVPAVITETKEIPVTTNGKKIEVAVKQILCLMNIKTSASVANPECLEFYRSWAAAN